ncbi:MAG: hypothetical protein A3D44_03645 [Candidatus Staskawiczbacteria bacterium RIFCSPHIGHO2_02_FULL_42_22]|uniref:AI-2E family transporter n=1 Tax=Candidatus Staskawiczbacteria bacterium RIFCSPHIGHO2_02_FULL_42_22 TaxID=1802207 RepID=A0A1G2I420_9BACT|nr:MAG: hypothetical protein A3D44_03645 [Candidatus Staskawiczbacteria bacterium RIFCSPHIGHO2_02_FULL_42_22]
MDNKKIRHYFLLTLLGGAIIATFFVLRPIMYATILALVCAIVCYPVHQKILHLAGNRQRLAALVTTLLIVVIVLVPLIFLGIKVFAEAQQLYLFLARGTGKHALVNISEGLLHGLKNYVPFGQWASADIDQYVQQGLRWLLNHLGYIFGSAAKLLLNFFIFIMVVYYALKDGHMFKKGLMELSPLTADENAVILKKINLAIHSVIKGSLIIALIQGILTGIGFALFGVPNAMLWAILATITSLIPGIGTTIVLLPAVAFVFATKSIFLALGLLAWGGFLVGLIDNFLKPNLIGKGAHIHPLIIFLSVLGGIAFLGPIGFLLGPLTISILLALLEIYTSWRNNQEE